ncbi:T9SS type A sorting domain-containing protein [Costertonia aggregata]|uniref:T9SS type A sorting domain-containing protein n=1 Tax=Costertonia aggregata TaxID=343403 RepID=A0A7H9ATI0_9FLAO|nr:T9SS type A sorting domain-containing protein [Costertonia aggregata]QLG46750.1 T9SS type A sorting domain-containing protein [Costertonia aggregata]
MRFLSLFFALFNFLFALSQQDIDALGELTDELSENSGLIFYDGRLITHNDSGNSPQLFEIDTVTLQIARTITLTNASNVDWEDITQDDEFIYVGDFGNNSGVRQDLSIYKISKEDYKKSDNVVTERIDFKYENQTDFIKNGNSDWDAEAMFVLDDTLIILTKQWKSMRTSAYSVPTETGLHTAKLLGSHEVNGLVTGATYNTVSDVLYLSGYSPFLQPFIVRVDGVETKNIFGNNQVKMMLNIDFAQIEGITWVDKNRYFLSSELFENANPPVRLKSQLFTFTSEDKVESDDILDEGGQLDEEKLVIYRKPNSSILQYNFSIDKELQSRAIYDTTGKRVQFSLGDTVENTDIDLSAFQKSIYYLTFHFNGRTVSKPFIWD